jgi:para-nitrobenzyl esterase
MQILKTTTLLGGMLIFSVSCNGKDTSVVTQSDLLVETKSGPVLGTKTDDMRVFLGIPYAMQPVGSQRWKAPQPVKPWSGPLKATKLGSACNQPIRESEPLMMLTDEDCLSLNIWTPALSTDDRLPVMVWIHGGAYKRGSGGQFVGKHLAAHGNVVVTLNYRLNIFGFLALNALTTEDEDHLTSGNYGLEDQRLAMEWVQQNIANFGGDPNNVTLFGESAGGGSVCAHLVSPASDGLFQKAIMQSGPCDLDVPLKTAEQTGEKVVNMLGCDKAKDVLECLRGKSAEELLAVKLSFYPVFDGVVLPNTQTQLLAQGAFSKVPVLLGTNKDEGTRQTLFFGGMADISEAEYQGAVKDMFAHSNIDADAVLAQYPASNYLSPGWALATIQGEWQFNCVIRRSAHAMAADVKTYFYYLTYERSTTPMGEIGAFHTEDLELVFFETKRKGFELKENEKDVSKALMGYWTRFAKTGNPNGYATVTWPSYNMVDDRYIEFGPDTAQVKSGLLPQCDFWDEWVGK